MSKGQRASGRRADDARVSHGSKPLRVLFLCTGNSARSQLAEALLARKGAGRFEAGSAGVAPQGKIHPNALAVLAEFGIDWSGHQPKNIEAVVSTRWDLVITVCDRARETCPVLPGRPIFAHWGMPDPAAIEEPVARDRAFRETLHHLVRRIDLMLAIPFESLERYVIEEKLRRIGNAVPEISASGSVRR